MDSREALRAMVKGSGQSYREVSATLGRSSGFVSAYLTQGRAPGADLLAEVADACGYSLQLVPRDSSREVLTISPRATPGKAGKADTSEG